MCKYRFIGVADIAAVRFSLPAHLLEPTPNLGMSTLWFFSQRAWVWYICLLWMLEYWGYMDRPETFVKWIPPLLSCECWKLIPGSIAEPTDPFGRMMNVLRFWFTKDLVLYAMVACWGFKSPRSNRKAEICQGQARQTVQFRVRRVLPGGYHMLLLRSVPLSVGWFTR